MPRLNTHIVRSVTGLTFLAFVAMYGGLTLYYVSSTTGSTPTPPPTPSGSRVRSSC
ncbi:hypothetical protein [Aurantimonas endophytica]|uniref:Uncharacterized protein n=1 Tax=Aurantimonas endophytica TaxID=1522175 RepID=A0A7W6MRT1_9HYPH|nr:hypothetical protein [Aurantimonas endophytica]MBB4005387.1 hypothetical protein [Aurantimonas endophytica]